MVFEHFLLKEWFRLTSHYHF